MGARQRVCFPLNGVRRGKNIQQQGNRKQTAYATATGRVESGTIIRINRRISAAIPEVRIWQEYDEHRKAPDGC